MVVAVITMLVVQTTIYQKVNVVTMWYEFVPAADVITLAIYGFTISRIGVADLNDMFVVVIAMAVMQMPIMQVIDVITMLDASVTAEFTVCMYVRGMDFM